MPEVEFPHSGIETWVNQHGIRILRLHYSADADKTPEWAEKEKAGMTDPARYRQEYEIDHGATLGQLIYTLDDEATLEKSFPIPKDWTRYYGLDPHIRVPHASLWCAVDKFGDRWYYRELWPSKAYGKPGNVPEDDNRYSIKQYLEAVKWLESKDNPENEHLKGDERIFTRVIDYAARGFGKGTTDDPLMDNFQTRFENTGRELGMDLVFEDAKKDHSVGIPLVNEGLKPLEVEDRATGKWIKKSRIHIFQDKCPELVLQLHSNRWKQLTPLQAESQDPLGTAMEKRNHQTDLLRYIEMANPEFTQPGIARSTWEPIVKGIQY